MKIVFKAASIPWEVHAGYKNGVWCREGLKLNVPEPAIIWDGHLGEYIPFYKYNREDFSLILSELEIWRIGQ